MASQNKISEKGGTMKTERSNRYQECDEQLLNVYRGRR